MIEHDLINALEKTGDYRVLKRLTTPIPSDDTTETGIIRTGLYVDVETTGFNPDSDEIIQLGMIPFHYTEDGRIIRTLAPLNQLQEPQAGVIPEIITRITGLTFNDVKGHKINANEVNNLVNQADLVIAHNAAFDRPFLENNFSVFKTKPWACSIQDVPWKDNGFETTRLKYILTDLGYYFDAHDALADCAAGITLLSARLENGATAFSVLLQNANKTTHILEAVGAPFEAKDALKARGYKWNPGQNGKSKAWWTQVDDCELDSELQWLTENIYRRPMNLNPQSITSVERYSSHAPR